MPTPDNPFTPRSKDNPHGALYREVTVMGAVGGATDGAIEIALSSESAVERWDWMTGDTYLEVLDHGVSAGPDLSYAKDGLPFCMDHEIDEQIGLVENVRLDGDRVLRGEVRQGNHPDAPWIFADMRTGIRKKVSIGYWPGDTYTQEKNAQGQVVRRYVGWTLYECSSVAIPADYEVGVGRSARGAAPEAVSPEAADEAHTMESTMAEITTPVAGLVPAPDTRAQDLAALAVQHDRATDLPKWIRDGRSVNEVKDLILDEMTARNAARPTVAAGGPVVEVGKDRAEDKPWGHDGEFFRAVIVAEQSPGQMDARLRAQRSSGANVGIPSEGGFAVPAGEVGIFLDSMYQTGEILSRVTRRPITVGNTYSERLLKESSRASGSRFGGMTAAWVGEGNDIAASKPALREVNLTLRKVAAAAYLTEEQMADGPALQSFISQAAPEVLKFAVEEAVWGGTGAGQPLGMLNGAGTVSQAIEATQTIANTSEFIWKNAANMYGRAPAALRGKAFWFINQELYAKIITSTAGTAANGATALFMAPGRLEDAPNGAILGRPIVPVEYASAEGTVGDFVFANFSDYLLIDKGGISQAASMHVRFLQDEQVLKFTYRVDGAPRTNVAITPNKGTQTQSPYITLAARS